LTHGNVNADGYGVVWYRDSIPVRVASDRPIWQDGNLRTLLAGARSSTILAAVRNATPGLPICNGTLPLVHDSWSFILNGFVEDFRSSYMRALRSSLPDDLYGSLADSSDSETLFLLALAAIRRGASMLDALHDVRSTVLEALNSERHEAQLTMVLADSERIALLHTSSRDATNSLYTAAVHPLAPEGTLVASEQLDDHTSWRVVAPHDGIYLTL
jgi:glutamine amidotransferase